MRLEGLGALRNQYSLLNSAASCWLFEGAVSGFRFKEGSVGIGDSRLSIRVPRGSLGRACICT